MSKTVKGKKAPGYEYWASRCSPGAGGEIPGRVTKKRTHKKERRVAKKDEALDS
jgi:hypothetical protein